MDTLEKKNLKQSLAEAIALHQAGKLDDAQTLYQTILLSYPNNADALSRLGTLNIQRGKHEQAARLLQASLEVNPSQPDICNNLGHTLRMLQRPEEALKSFDKAVALKPDYLDAYYNRGVVLLELKRFDEALANFDKTVALNPNYALPYNNRGVALWELKRHSDALASYGKAIALKPDYASAYYNRAVLLLDLRRYDEARSDFRRAMQLNPDMPYVLGYWLFTKMHLSDWGEMEEGFAHLAQGIEMGKRVTIPLILAATPLSEAQQKKCVEMYVQDKCPPMKPLWTGEKYAHDKIRIGYFSHDFHENHPVPHLMAGLLALHDRSKFEVTAFSFGPQTKDAMRQRLKNAVDVFVDVSHRQEADIAALARSREIDIAVDLMGFTTHSRTGIFARRPAPVQVNYLGYPGTMAAPYIDYLIADPVIIPEKSKSYYSEKIVTLPHSYLASDASRVISETNFTRSEMELPEKGFVFCCFNNHYKITPAIFDIWMRLLKQVEGSVLWLSGGNATSMKNLRAEARVRGVADHRLVFTKRMEDMADHLARQRLADLFLDTFYYNAHSTASDALWAGLPVLTCLGETFAGRVAASLLQAIGLPDLVTRSHQEYEALALELATHPKKLSAIRDRLAQNRVTQPLFNTPLFAKHIETAYVQMWEKTQAGLPPCDIRIDA